MSARYILRFDDISPTMNWDIWDRVEEILVREGVRPILAVIPNNADPTMRISIPRADFWERVRGWQTRGWTVGLHGDEHRYVTTEAGLVGLNARSEFAGLPQPEQEGKIARGLATFEAEGVRADLFVAPSHSFDRATIAALKTHGIGTISDGFYLHCVRRYGVTFVPQQLWSFRRMPFGVWTVCLHHNEFTPRHVADLARDVRTFRDDICAVEDILPTARPFNALDALAPRLWFAAKAAAGVRKTLRNAVRTLVPRAVS